MRGALIKIAAEMARVVAVVIALHAVAAVASSVGGSALPTVGSGGLVGPSGPIALTGPVSVTGTISVTQGVSAVTGVFTSTNGDAIIAVGQGAGEGGQFTGGATAGTPGVLGTGGAGGGAGVRGVGTGLYSGGQFEAAANGGRAIYLVGDTTSPQYPLIGVSACQDANPSASAVVGDLTCVAGSPVRWRVATATTPTFRSLAYTDAETFTGPITISPGSGNTLTVTGTGAGEGIYAESANNSASQAIQVNGNGAGNGLYAGAAGGGYAAQFVGDATTPSKAPINILPYDDDPAACTVGDIGFCNGNANCGGAVGLRCCTATNTWGGC